MNDDDNKFKPEELANLRESTKEILANLTVREAIALRERFGINFAKDHDLEDVGRQFEVTRKRIREIEAKALRKLKAKNEKEQNQNCSFCGKSINDAVRMVKSEINNVYICNECIKTCGDLLDER